MYHANDQSPTKKVYIIEGLYCERMIWGFPHNPCKLFMGLLLYNSSQCMLLSIMVDFKLKQGFGKLLKNEILFQNSSSIINP